MGVILATSLTFAINAQAEDSLSTVYHIYLQNEYMGTVDNQNVIEELSSLKINKLKDTYKDYLLTVEDIEIIPEKMFRPVFNNAEVIENLEQKLDVVVEATVLKINDQEVAAFQDSSTAQNVLEVYKQQYVSKEVLDDLAAQQKNQPLPALKEGQSRITEVSFTARPCLIKKLCAYPSATFFTSPFFPFPLTSFKKITFMILFLLLDSLLLLILIYFLLLVTSFAAIELLHLLNGRHRLELP